jgi:hypothetical protein
MPAACTSEIKVTSLGHFCLRVNSGRPEIQDLSVNSKDARTLTVVYEKKKKDLTYRKVPLNLRVSF